MKLAGAQKVHYDSGPNLIPLVDVVLVILIFLMMAGSFGGAEHYLVSTLPITPNGAGKVTSGGFEQNTTLEIRVDSMMNHDEFIATAGRVQTRDANSLRVQLTRMKDQFVSNGTPVERVQVVINPNYFCKYQTVVLVYQSCLEAGFTKVGFHAAH
jgi:biopolymer transport protein ExbD